MIQRVLGTELGTHEDRMDNIRLNPGCSVLMDWTLWIIFNEIVYS